MWKLNPFGGKAQSGLDGRTIDVGSVKITVRNAIAQGGFSCVYLACDTVHPSKMYALKHIICNDSESLDLVMKEIQVMNLLKGHPNVVTLVAHDVFDMGRTKEALLVMEFCEKSLVSAMESRGSGYYEEKKVLLIFRDVCNAVFAMHGQSPPIAHRDLKAENVLLGLDGAWKICDFGSTSTNHKCFNKPEEMGANTPLPVRLSREGEAAPMSPVTALLAGTAVPPAPSPSPSPSPSPARQHARHYSVGFPALPGGGGRAPLAVECSSRPQKKGTKHHMKTRPKKTQPWDIKRRPTQYPPLPPLPPDWTLVASGATVDVEEATAASPVLEVAVAVAAPAAAD